MIRFSAGLVVVAIGVLIGGVATSKLSLVYVAIAVSAVALVALAIGVALKRDELFGDGPELGPAAAGADSGQSAGGYGQGSPGHVREDLQQIRPNVPVASQPAAFGGPVAASAAPLAAARPPVGSPPVGSPAGGRAMDSSALGNPPPGQRRPAFGQASARVADSTADWQTRSPQPSWSSGDQASPTWTPTEQTAKAAPSGTAPVPPLSPRAWGNPDPSSSASSASPAGSAAAAPSWFDRLNRPVDDPAARTGTEPSPAESAATESPKDGSFRVEPPTVAAATVAAATVAAAKASAAKTSAGDDDSSAVTQASPVMQTDAGDSDTDLDVDDWPTRYSWLEDDESVEGAEAGKPAEADDAARVAEPSADAKLVTVIPGVPRYHDPDCILIRFMDEADIARKSVPEAKAANCTPCAACQPQG